MRSVFLLALFLASCAAERTRSGNILRIAGSHYQSMAGVSLKGDEAPMTCNREMMTGSHIPRWYCRIGDEPTQYEFGRRIVLDLR